MNPTLRPTLKQHQAFQILQDKETNFLLFGGAAGGGKSWIGCEWLLTNCYLYPNTRWFIARKELKRLMASTYQTWVKVTRHHNIPSTDWSLNSQMHYIQFTNGSRIDLLDVAYQPSDPEYERLGSIEFTGGFGEEVGEWDFKAFDTLKSRIGRQLNTEYGLTPPKFFLTCNPTRNWVYKVFYEPTKNGNLAVNYKFIQSLYKDNPHTADVYAAQLETISDATLRARLRDGLWEYSTDDLAIFNYSAVLDLFTNRLDDSKDKYFSADIARFGSDKIVYGMFRGMNLYRLEERSKQSIMHTENEIRDLLHKEFIPFKNAIIDEDGVGGGVLDHLEGINGFMGGRSPLTKKEDTKTNIVNAPASYLTKPNYKNLRSQCYFLLADAVNNRRMSISAPVSEEIKYKIIEELMQIKRVDTGTDAPLQIIPKDDIKENIGRSPDYADMLMMRLYFLAAIPDTSHDFYLPPAEYLQERGVATPFGGVGWN